jgi:NADH-quinone oxidoreductase subunit D
VHAAQATGTHRLVDIPARPGDIALGPDHPTLDGLPSLAMEVRDGVVVGAEWVPGTVHRGAEKLFESRDYRQILMLVDRHDWLSAFCSEIGVVVGVERALGLTPPERAQHVRILLCELTRIAHHLAFLAPLPGPLPDAWRARAWQWRGEILDLIEAATGHRVHPMFCQVGGVRADVGTDWVAGVAEAAAAWSASEPSAALAAIDGPELAAALDSRYSGVAVLSTAQALGFGASGPVARASGVDLDLRRDDPYLPYPAFDVPRDAAGDARARIRMLVDELAPSIGVVAWAAEQLAASAGAPVDVRLPKVVRVPEGSTYTWTENPTGINGYLLVSRNDRTPWRLKLRSAGFGNAAALGAALEGTAVSDLPAAIASFLIVCGDVDR